MTMKRVRAQRLAHAAKGGERSRAHLPGHPCTGPVLASLLHLAQSHARLSCILLLPFRRYHVRLRVIAADGQAVLSPPASVSTDPAPPAPPPPPAIAAMPAVDAGEATSSSGSSDDHSGGAGCGSANGGGDNDEKPRLLRLCVRCAPGDLHGCALAGMVLQQREVYAHPTFAPAFAQELAATAAAADTDDPTAVPPGGVLLGEAGAGLSVAWATQRTPWRKVMRTPKAQQASPQPEPSQAPPPQAVEEEGLVAFFPRGLRPLCHALRAAPAPGAARPGASKAPGASGALGDSRAALLRSPPLEWAVALEFRCAAVTALGASPWSAVATARRKDFPCAFGGVHRLCLCPPPAQQLTHQPTQQQPEPQPQEPRPSFDGAGSVRASAAAAAALTGPSQWLIDAVAAAAALDAARARGIDEHCENFDDDDDDDDNDEDDNGEDYTGRNGAPGAGRAEARLQEKSWPPQKPSSQRARAPGGGGGRPRSAGAATGGAARHPSERASAVEQAMERLTPGERAAHAFAPFRPGAVYGGARPTVTITPLLLPWRNAAAAKGALREPAVATSKGQGEGKGRSGAPSHRPLSDVERLAAGIAAPTAATEPTALAAATEPTATVGNSDLGVAKAGGSGRRLRPQSAPSSSSAAAQRLTRALGFEADGADDAAKATPATAPAVTPAVTLDDRFSKPISCRAIKGRASKGRGAVSRGATAGKAAADHVGPRAIHATGGRFAAAAAAASESGGGDRVGGPIGDPLVAGTNVAATSPLFS